MALNIYGNIITGSDITSVGVFKTEVNRDGLICFLDAANKNSYPGSGTVWYDLTGNGYNGTFNAGVTFDSVTNGGIIVLDGTGYVTTTVPNLAGTNYTVMVGQKYSGATRGRITTCTVNNWLLGCHSTTTENYYAEGWITGTGGIGANDTNWRIVAGTGNISEDQYVMYVNGAITYNNNGGSAGPNIISICGYTGERSTASVSFLLVYNRVLSPYEISENFQAFRGRLSL
jgi:hypothetical protein